MPSRVACQAAKAAKRRQKVVKVGGQMINDKMVEKKDLDLFKLILVSFHCFHYKFHQFGDDVCFSFPGDLRKSKNMLIMLQHILASKLEDAVRFNTWMV